MITQFSPGIGFPLPVLYSCPAAGVRFYFWCRLIGIAYLLDFWQSLKILAGFIRSKLFTVLWISSHDRFFVLHLLPDFVDSGKNTPYPRRLFCRGCVLIVGLLFLGSFGSIGQ